MRAYVYIRQNSPLYEIIIATFILNTKNDVIIVTDGDKEILTSEGIKILASLNISEVVEKDIDIFIITGGEIDKSKNKDLLAKLIRNIYEHKKILAGICTGSDVISDALKLNLDYIDKTINLDNKIILSPPNEYVDFGIEIGKAINIYDNHDDYLETVDFFKHFRYFKG